jgi:nitrogen fixation/metabolism regulation signal transduction histidine kinase
MAIGRRIIQVLVGAVIVLGVLLWIAALLLFSQVAENSDDFARYANAILLINLAGIGVLVALIGSRLVRLVRDYRRFVPGSRLQARMVSRVVVLCATPLVILYMFSVSFINRGIDDWFNVDVSEGLDNAIELSQAAFEVQRHENLSQLGEMAAILGKADRSGLIAELGELRRGSGAIELSIFDSSNQIVATNSGNPAGAVPAYPTDELLLQIRQNLPYISLDLRPDGQYEITAATRIVLQGGNGEYQILRGKFPVDQRISVLANAVQASHDQYAALNFLSASLKYSFTLTLSLVLFVAVLASVYGAFFAAQRLIVPIQQLMQGTRAVARGDFDTKLPSAAPDEIGFLVHSFNDMTQRLALARQETRQSEHKLESERHKLEVILTNLTTGVVSLETDLRIRTANQAAGTILEFDLEAHIGESLVELAESHSLLSQFISVTRRHLARGQTDWREQITLRGQGGQRELMCAFSSLPSSDEGEDGYVVVFDDITALMQAQRDAAWGEVARRLAHEIKNPLTPIQLSAERLRRRYLGRGDGEADSELLDRATHTIIQQVDAMKDMVNAFSEYARAPQIELKPVDLNKLVGEVTELYRHQPFPVAIDLSLDGELPVVDADAGRLRQVLHNLMRNAIEATEGRADARIEVQTRRVGEGSGRQAEVVVRDNGPGFADDIVDRAFYPYVTSKTKGTGLGLAIVKKLVEEHGGTIRITNAERGGAFVSILMPVPDGNESGATETGRQYQREQA